MKTNENKIKELQDKAYEIATKKYGDESYNYPANARAQAMTAYALLTIVASLIKNQN